MSFAFDDLILFKYRAPCDVEFKNGLTIAERLLCYQEKRLSGHLPESVKFDKDNCLFLWNKFKVSKFLFILVVIFLTFFCYSYIVPSNRIAAG